MSDPMRVTAQEVRKKTHSGDAVLVCAYDDDAKCKDFQLENAITLTKFKSTSADMDRSKEIFFFCA